MLGILLTYDQNPKPYHAEWPIIIAVIASCQQSHFPTHAMPIKAATYSACDKNHDKQHQAPFGTLKH